jgi:hypothetical protein
MKEATKKKYQLNFNIINIINNKLRVKIKNY